MAENIIYIATNEVQLICGSCDKTDMIKIERFERYPLDEGTMLNGVILEDHPVLEILNKIKSSGITTVSLVIDSGQILTKNIEVPIVKQKELIAITKDELAELNSGYEDMIYDYCVLRNSYEEKEHSGGEILCCGLERKLLSGYLDVFDAAGMKLQNVDISLNALHKLTQEVSELDQKTYIVSVLDANNVYSFLFENNHYTFSNRTRLFSERGTAEFIAEMNSNISQLIQFSKSKHGSYTIETAYFCRLEKDEEEKIFPNIKANLNIDAQRFPDSKVVYVTKKGLGKQFYLNDYVFTVGSLLRK